MCVPVCVCPGASSGCRCLCKDMCCTWGLGSAFPQGNHEGGTKGAIAVAASTGSVPCSHSLPHKEPGLASP